jgi:hypothetical protein
LPLAQLDECGRRVVIKATALRAAALASGVQSLGADPSRLERYV